MQSRREASFTNGVVILTVSAVIVKLIGVCYKIPLVRLLGTEGMGNFNAAYDVYALLCMISTTGLPVAVSVMMNQHRGQHKRIFWLSLSIFLFIGVLGAAVVFFAADAIANRIGAPGAAQSLRFIAPAVLFICVSGALRGYYQGMRNMLPTAVSQVIEAASKLIFGLCFAYIAIMYGQGKIVAAAFAVLGLSVGTLLSVGYLWLPQKRPINLDPQGVPIRVLFAQMLKVAFPVTLGAAVSGLSKMIDLGLIMRRLQDVGFGTEASVSLYGCYSAMVIPLYSAVPALFGSVALPLVPHLSYAIERNDIQKQRELLGTTFRLTALISVPGAIGMGMLSDRLLQLLYQGSDELKIAVPLLLIISIAVPASCLITATNAILQAYSRAWIPMLSTVIGCLIKAVSLYYLTGIEEIGILAAPISTLLCCTVIVLINLAFIAKVAPDFSFIPAWARAIAFSGIAIGAASLIKRAMQMTWKANLPIIAITVATAVIIYTIIAFKFGLLRISDIKSNKEKE